VARTPSSIQTQAERWGAEAKRLADNGDVPGAFDLYRKAAEALPGAPWLQHRTADMARKLGQHELSIHYFRRSADGFIRAGFPRRGIAPLRLAWTLARSALPQHLDVFGDISQTLVNLQRQLELLADAEVTADQTEEALRHAGIRGEPAPLHSILRTADSTRITLAPSQG